MKKYFLLFVLLLLSSLSSFGSERIKITVSPAKPVKGENFQILFTCKVDGREEPDISFNPEGLEILGRQAQGTSTRMMYSQGKMTYEKEMTFSYDAIANKIGSSYLSDIEVVIDGKKEKLPSYKIDVVNEPQEASPIFVAADVPKKKVYVGEGITVRYYIYVHQRVALNAFDIKKFPALPGFMKRFLQEPDQQENVQLDGEIYRRSLIYTSRLFAERPGMLEIDPMKVSVTYLDRITNPFGFGANPRDRKSRNLDSEKIAIQVLSLPEVGKGKNFSGLVGEHTFDLKAEARNMLVNEPLEVKLTISGDGGLENLDTPKLYPEGKLEQFEVKSDLRIVSSDRAMKVLDYTYLAKDGGEVPALDVEFTYFNPQSQSYVPVKLTLPPVKIVGSARVPPPAKEIHTEDSLPRNEERKNPVEETLAGTQSQGSFITPYLLVSVLMGLVFLSLSFEIYQLVRGQSANTSHGIYQSFKKGKVAYSDLMRLIGVTVGPNLQIDSVAAIQKMNLSNSSKQYLIQLLSECERNEFTSDKKGVTTAADAKFLSELKKLLKQKTV